jgi:CubicO group peptidase (beta-lactamase class C family)
MSHFTKLPGHFLWLSTGLLATLLCVIACKEQKRTSTKQEAATIEVIDEEAIHSLGVNTGVLADMEKAISSGEYPNIHSVLILKGGKLIYERYFPGNDEHWGDDLGQVQNSRERLHDVRSISKSVVSTCIGLAIAQGKIKDVHQKVFDLLPEYSQYSTGPKSDLTLEHLLTMTSGFEWNEDLPYSDPENSEIKMTSSPDPIAYVLSRPLESDPGKAWKYNGGTTQLLAAILEKKTGRKVY